MTLPVLPPQWATDADADIDEPTTGRKEDGWAADEKPPSGWMNWWMKNVYEHLNHLRDITYSNWFHVDNEGSVTENFYSVGWDGDETFVAVGEAATVQWSWRGERWNAESFDTATGAMSGVVWGEADSLWVAVGRLAGGNGQIESSPDGVTWTARAPGGSSDDLNDVAYGGGIFVAVGDAGEIQRSTNGTAWTQETSDGPTAQGFNSITYGDGLFVAVGSSGTVQTSPDGTNWTAQTPVGTPHLWGIAYGNGLYVIMGSGDSIQTSEDAITWTTRTSPAYGAIERLRFGDGVFVAVGLGDTNGSAMVFTSIDALTWTKRTPANMSGFDYLYDVAHGNGTFVAVGDNGEIQRTLRTE